MEDDTVDALSETIHCDRFGVDLFKSAFKQMTSRTRCSGKKRNSRLKLDFRSTLCKRTCWTSLRTCNPFQARRYKSLIGTLALRRPIATSRSVQHTGYLHTSSVRPIPWPTHTYTNSMSKCDRISWKLSVKTVLDRIHWRYTIPLSRLCPWLGGLFRNIFWRDLQVIEIHCSSRLSCTHCSSQMLCNIQQMDRRK